MYSIIIPVYKNEASLPELIEAITNVNRQLDEVLEVVFVVDGSPDNSYSTLAQYLPQQSFHSQLIVLSRNYGSFAAIREGLRVAHGKYFAVMAADLQEPPELAIKFFSALSNESVDVTIGIREHRSDPLISRLFSWLFWVLYRRFIQSAMPPGGIDVFGCNVKFRDRLLAMEESNSSLVGLIIWMGFRRKLIGYSRQPRRHGKSGWTFKRKIRYLSDSIFSFSDLPIRILVTVGFIGLCFACCLSLVVFLARFLGEIKVPGYTTTVLVVSFFAGLNSLGLGVIGSYVWRAFENTKRRPQAIIMDIQKFDPIGK